MRLELIHLRGTLRTAPPHQVKPVEVIVASDQGLPLDVSFVQLGGDTETDSEHAGRDYLYRLALKFLVPSVPLGTEGTRKHVSSVPSVPLGTEETSWGEVDLGFLDKNCYSQNPDPQK